MFIECAAGVLGRSPDSRQNKKPLRSLTGVTMKSIGLGAIVNRVNSVNSVNEFLRRQESWQTGLIPSYAAVHISR